MSRRNLRKIILFGSVVMVGLLVVQGFWLLRAFDIEERQFNHTVQVAMKSVTDSIVTDRQPEHESEIRQLSSRFFFAKLNSAVNPEKLDSLIKKELGLRQILADYELGIYRAEDDTLVHGEYIPATIQWQIDHAKDENSAVPLESYNFAIYFPNKMSVIAGELRIWIFSTVVLLLMTVFFIYAIVTLLKEKKLSEIKEDFVNNLTHEFKTPIANIELASDALKQNNFNAEHQSRYFQIIHDENQRLKSQVERILQMGAISQNNLQLNKQPVNIHGLINKLVDSISMRVKDKSGNIFVDLEATNSQVIADEFHITNTVYNLLDNAEKYSPENPDIDISTRNTEHGLIISVNDKGIGISSDLQKLVFDKFFRVPTGNVHNVKGFGLGLSYVKTIIEAHKGKIMLHSQPNLGSRFDIYLPSV